MSQPGILLMQATIGGMSLAGERGAAVVYAGFDTGLGVLLMAEGRRLGPGEAVPRRQGYAVLSNYAGSDSDVVFAETDLQEAIRDYFAFAGRGLLEFADQVNAFNPQSKIEPDGLDESGRKFRVGNDISNGQVAVIALCWFAVRQSGFAAQLEAFDDMQDPRIRSIGLPGDEDDDDDGQRRRAVVRYEMGGELPIGEDGWPV